MLFADTHTLSDALQWLLEQPSLAASSALALYWNLGRPGTCRLPRSTMCLHRTATPPRCCVASNNGWPRAATLTRAWASTWRRTGHASGLLARPAGAARGSRGDVVAARRPDRGGVRRGGFHLRPAGGGGWRTRAGARIDRGAHRVEPFACERDLTPGDEHPRMAWIYCNARGQPMYNPPLTA